MAQRTALVLVFAFGIAAAGIVGRFSTSPAASASRPVGPPERSTPRVAQTGSNGPESPSASSSADEPPDAAPSASGLGAARDRIVEERTAAYEKAAFRILFGIAAAQQQLQFSGAIDTDRDGQGEHGFFGELAGTRPLRVRDAQSGEFGLGETTLDPPFLPPEFGRVVADATGDGVVVYQGYVYKLYLPGPSRGESATDEWIAPGIGEAPAGGTPADALTRGEWGSDNCELFWCVYAWPIDAAPGETGRRAFFFNQYGTHLGLDNHDGQYRGLERVPAFDAALTKDLPASMLADLAPSSGSGANDGNEWRALDPRDF